MNTFTNKAKWIGLGEGGFAIGVQAPAIELRKSFTLDKKPEGAECLILGLGLHVLYINGRRVGDVTQSPFGFVYFIISLRKTFVNTFLNIWLTKKESVMWK